MMMPSKMAPDWLTLSIKLMVSSHRTESRIYRWLRGLARCLNRSPLNYVNGLDSVVEVQINSGLVIHLSHQPVRRMYHCDTRPSHFGQSYPW